ncbi:MAG: AMP-binding protein [Nitriliruptorales bacterium]|nr:AMP-binding protein [Nitriliruptorales bacterium]
MSIYDERPWLTHYPPHIEPTLDLRYPTMLDAWRGAVERSPDRPCVRYFDHVLTFEEVDGASDALAAALRGGGFERGDRVGIFLQNDPQWPVAMLATWKAGGVPVALNPMFKQRELAYHLGDSRAKVLLCLEHLHEEVARDVVGDTDVRRVITTHPSDLLPDGSELAPFVTDSVGGKRVADGTEDLAQLLKVHRAEIPGVELPGPSPDDVAVLTYTSGTTGKPKGAMNTHRGMSFNSQLYVDWFQLDQQDEVFGVAPLFHITGIVAHMGASWVSGAPLGLFHRFDPGVALRLMEEWKATFVVGSITVYIALMDHPDMAGRDLSSLAKVASGGAPVSPSIVDRFEKATGVRILNIYGLTETTSPSHLTPPGSAPPVDADSGALSVGLPVPDADVHVVDLETGEDVQAGELGEIVIAGPMVVPGYWEKPEETEHAIPGGRLHTGDVGFMDEDGWFFIVDRKKDQINAGGYKIWPREVEDVLYEHPAVREAAVVGVPDEYRGETVKAFVALTSGAEATGDELVAFCKERMAAYKYPREVEILDELPKTPTGKFLRRVLRPD